MTFRQATALCLLAVLTACAHAAEVHTPAPPPVATPEVDAPEAVLPALLAAVNAQDHTAVVRLLPADAEAASVTCGALVPLRSQTGATLETSRRFLTQLQGLTAHAESARFGEPVTVQGGTEVRGCRFAVDLAETEHTIIVALHAGQELRRRETWRLHLVRFGNTRRWHLLDWDRRAM